MKTGLICTLLSLLFFTVTFAEMKIVEAPKPKPAAAPAAEPDAPAAMTPEEHQAEKSRFDSIKLPEKDSPEYWVVRSEAITELTKLLTSKRAEMKQKRQMLADYLLEIGKGEEMASQNIEVPDDPKLYAEALGMDEVYAEKDIDMPQKLPTWEESAEFAMRFIIDEGYVPMQFDGAEDVASYIELTKKKEQYGQKVRREMRGYVKDALKIWIYLGTINQQAACKKWAVQIKLDAEASKNMQKAMLADERRMATLDRQEAAKQQKYDDAQARASFRSTRRQRTYQSRQDQLQYQQTLLADRYTRSYRW